MDKNEFAKNKLEVQLEYFITENRRLTVENDTLRALIAQQAKTRLTLIELINKTLAETHGGERC